MPSTDSLLALDLEVMRRMIYYGRNGIAHAIYGRAGSEHIHRPWMLACTTTIKTSMQVAYGSGGGPAVNNWGHENSNRRLTGKDQ